jgi:hypothetical protein
MLKGHAQGPGDVAAEDAGGQAVGTVVGHSHRFFDTLHAHHRGDGAKGFLVVDLHAGLDMVDDGGRHHGTRSACRRVASLAPLARASSIMAFRRGPDSLGDHRADDAGRR